MRDQHPTVRLNWARKSLLATALVFASASVQATDVGMSIRIGQPGFYGEIHLGDFYPVPDLVYPDPVIIHTPPQVVQQPIYLHAPHKHVRNWRRYCIQYRACDRPVYFVQEHWYNDVYVPRYNQQPRHIQQPQVYRHDNTYRGHDSSYRYYDTDHEHDRHGNRRHEKGHDKDLRHGHGKHDRNDHPGRGHGNKHHD